MSDLRATLFERLRDPRAVPILARHAIPVIGVFVLGWSVLETIAALFLDGLSTLWLLAAMGSYFAVKELDWGEPGIIAALQFWAGVLGSFLVIAAILSVAILVPAMFFLPLVQSADVDPMSLVTSGWLPRAFGFMVACQLPGFIQRIRHFQATGTPPEKMGVDAETALVLHRMVMLAVVATMLAAFGRYALPVMVIVAQAFGAGAEIMRDEYVGYLLSGRSDSADSADGARPATASPRPRSPAPRPGRKRRKR
jgi:hypothetical protein